MNYTSISNDNGGIGQGGLFISDLRFSISDFFEPGMLRIYWICFAFC
jgi:hypothetical protein